MRHFRGSRGTRRSGGRPRGSTVSAKYIVFQAGASEGAGTTVFSMANGLDNTVLGQGSVTDTAIPVGAKITSFDIFMPKVNLGAATANFVTWSIQHLVTGQSVISPITAGGSTLRKNIMLTGMIGLGAGQNSSLHVKFRVPPKYQRMGDGDSWQIVNDNGLAVSTQYYVIYKVHM